MSSLITAATRRRVVPPLLFACLTMGMTYTAATLANYFGDQLKLDNLELNLLPVSMFIWFLISGIPASKLMNRTSVKTVILLGIAAMFFGTLTPFIGDTFTNALLMFAFLGLGNVLLQVTFNPLLSYLAPKNDATSFMIWRQAIEALTAIALPLILIWSVKYFDSWRTALWLYVLLAGGALIWLSLIKIPNLPSEGKITWPILRSILKQPGIFLLLLGIVTIGGFNNSLTTILPRLIMERTNVAFGIANLSGTCFFGLRLLGGIFGAIVLTKISPWKFLRVMSIIGLAAIVVLLFSTNVWLMFTCVGTLGFAYSSLSSLIFAQVLLRAPTQTSAATGLVITSWAGASVFALLAGIITKTTGNQTSGVIFFVFCALVILYLGNKLSRLFAHSVS